MFFGKKNSQESAYSIPAAGSEGGLRLNVLVACILVVLVIAAMLAAYFLGYRVGYNNGLELAHKNSLAQVMRIPVAKAVAEKIDGLGQSGASTDIYEELKKQPVAKGKDAGKPAEASKEVKDFLKPTPTASALKGSAEKTPAPAATEAVKEVNEKRLADSNAIKDALKQVEEARPVTKEDYGIRVIGDPKTASAKAADGADSAELALNKQEDFNLAKTADNKANSALAAEPTAAAITPAPKQTPRVQSTPVATKTAEAKKEIQKAAASKLTTGWYTQVAAPKALKEAQSVAARLKAAGFKSIVETAQIGDQQYYRVVVGPDGSRLTAEQTLSRVRQHSGVKGEPFIRLVR